MPDAPTSLTPINCPFTILIDSMEQHPFSFTGLFTDADQDNRPLIVNHQWQALGVSNGDYSILGHHPDPARNVDPSSPRVAIERKSIEDCIGTILGFKERRGRFERELQSLSGLIDTGGSALVVVEGSMEAVLEAVAKEQHGNGKRSPDVNQKALFRSWIAFQQDHRVPWVFCDSRRMAEVYVFRWLERFHRKCTQGKKG